MSVNIAVLMPVGELRDLFVNPVIVQAFSALGNVKFNDNTVYESTSIKKLLADCHVCITGWGCPALDENLLATAQNLRLVAHTGGSVASLVSEHMYDRGIRVVSGNGIYAESVAEGTLAYILAALRRIPFYSQMVENGGWNSYSHKNTGLFDRKVGLVGFGAIPRYLVPMLRPFRVEISAYDPFVQDSIFDEYGVSQATSLEELFSQNDIISNHLPLTNETHRIVNAKLLSRMNKGALFVNTGRGGTVDESALEEILASGHISAALDVFETEPLPMTSKLRNLDNVILMPHMGGPTLDRWENVGLALAEDTQRMMNNQPLIWEIPRDYAVKMTNDRLIQGGSK
ncbi:MAG: hydroxyacid dehydrogenase [Defluviitaleaceae bacterium]|nr:hydroxyacid dehydrogenase [Defluviitaleaceae bacterium]